MRGLLLATLVGLIAAACAVGGDGTAGAPTIPALEAVLQVQLDAMSRGDLDAFQATVDQALPAFRRVQRERFDLRVAGLPQTGLAKIAKIDPYGIGYVRAYVEEKPEAALFVASSTPSYRRVYFRREGGGWILTEPKTAELGGEKTRTIGDVRVDYWAIDEDLVGLVAREADAARSFAARVVADPTRAALNLRLYPTAETIGVAGNEIVAAHLPELSRDNYIRLYHVWLTASLAEFSEFSRFVMKDQALGLVRETRAPGAYFRLDWWLRHGLADYLAAFDRTDALRKTCGAGMVPTFKQLFDGPPRMDLGGMDMGGDIFAPTYAFIRSPDAQRYLAHAHSMTEYLAATFGDLAYWNLVDAYRDSPDSKVTYERVLQRSPDRFYAEWLAWTKRKYC